MPADARPLPPSNSTWDPGVGTAETLARLLTRWQAAYFGNQRRGVHPYAIRRYTADDPALAPLVAYIESESPVRQTRTSSAILDISRAGMSTNLHGLIAAINRLLQFIMRLIRVANQDPDQLGSFADPQRSASPSRMLEWWLYNSVWSDESSARAEAIRDWLSCYGSAAQATSFEARFWRPYTTVVAPLFDRIAYGDPWPTLRSDLMDLAMTIPYLTMLAGAVAQPEPNGSIVVAAPSRAERDALSERRQVPLDILRKRHPVLFEPGPFAVLRVLLADARPWSGRALAAEAELTDGRHPAQKSVHRWLEELRAAGLATKGDGAGGWTAGDACYTRPAGA